MSERRKKRKLRFFLVHVQIGCFFPESRKLTRPLCEISLFLSLDPRNDQYFRLSENNSWLILEKITLVRLGSFDGSTDLSGLSICLWFISGFRGTPDVKTNQEVIKSLRSVSGPSGGEVPTPWSTTTATGSDSW